MLAVAMPVAIRRYLANSIAHRWCTAHTSLFTQRPQVFVLTGLGDNKRSCCLFFLYKSAINFQHKFKREEFVNSLDTERPAIQENIRLLGLKRSCAKAVVFNFSHQVVLWSYRSNLGLLACLFFFFFFSSQMLVQEKAQYKSMAVPVRSVQFGFSPSSSLFITKIIKPT